MRKQSRSFRAPPWAVDEVFRAFAELYCGSQLWRADNRLWELQKLRDFDLEEARQEIFFMKQRPGMWMKKHQEPKEVYRNDDGPVFVGGRRGGEGFYIARGPTRDLDWEGPLRGEEAKKRIRGIARDLEETFRIDAQLDIRSSIPDRIEDIRRIVELCETYTTVERRDPYDVVPIDIEDLRVWEWPRIEAKRGDVMEKISDETLYLETLKNLGRPSAMYNPKVGVIKVEITERENKTLTPSGVEEILEEKRRSIAHEMQHFYQRIFNAVKDIESGGESGFDEVPSEFRDKEYLLSPEEFYPKIDDEVKKFIDNLGGLDIPRRRLEEAIRVHTAGGGDALQFDYVRPSEIFEKWKRYDEDLWKKAVKEFRDTVLERRQ